jgi:predicted component of type VI protein secretion system
MTRLLLAGLVSTLAAGCASNRAADEPGARIRDTTMTVKDTTNPNDTLPRVRDSVPDSTRH